MPTVRLETLSAQPDAINWEFYKKHISKPGFVEAFEKSVSKDLKVCIVTLFLVHFVAYSFTSGSSTL